MKKSIVAAMAFIALITVSCSSEDENGNSPTNPNQQKYSTSKIVSGTDLTLRKIDFLDGNLGYIAGGSAGVGAEGIILKTTDGGLTWNKIHQKADCYFTGVQVISPIKVFATTNTGLILSSVDAGATWTENRQHSTIFYMSDIQFRDENLGVVIGHSPTTAYLIITRNGGETWTRTDGFEMDVFNGIDLNRVSFSGNNIYISGGTSETGVLLQSNDAGMSWTRSDVSSEVMLTAICANNNGTFATGHNGITDAALEKGKLFKTTDDGKTWNVIETGFTNKLNGLDSRANNICIIGSNKGDELMKPEFALLSFDGGASWERMKHQTKFAGWEDIAFTTDKKAFLIGYNGLIVKLTIK